MRHRLGHDDGLTLNQLLVSIVVIVILGSLFMAHIGTTAGILQVFSQPNSNSGAGHLGATINLLVSLTQPISPRNMQPQSLLIG